MGQVFLIINGRKIQLQFKGKNKLVDTFGEEYEIEGVQLHCDQKIPVQVTWGEEESARGALVFTSSISASRTHNMQLAKARMKSMQTRSMVYARHRYLGLDCSYGDRSAIRAKKPRRPIGPGTKTRRPIGPGIKIRPLSVEQLRGGIKYEY